MRYTASLIVAPSAAAVQASLVTDGGRIAAIESTDARVQAPHVVIVPGLIDAHTHAIEVGLELLFTSLTGSRTVAEVLERIRAGAGAGEPEGVYLVFNLEPDELAERRYLTRSELDAVTGNRPVLVYRVDGHSAVVNSAGLGLLQQEPTLSAEFDRDSADSGLLRGRAYELASRLFKRRLRATQIRAALKLASDEAARQGVTTLAAFVGTEATSLDEWAVIIDALAALPCRAVPFTQTWDFAVAREFGLKRIGGCLLIDGSFGSHTAALSEGYADEHGNAGCLYESDEKLVGFFRTANEQGLQAVVHAIGDRAVEQVVRCHEQAGTGNGNPLRHRIEHAELLNPDLIRRIAALGLILGVQPSFEAWWGGPDRLYSRRLGDRWRRTNPFRSLLDVGVRLAGGSDAPITPIDPLAGIRAAVSHPNAEQRVTPFEALAMFTTAAAYSLGLARETGRLAPGLAADFTVLTGDPRATDDCRVIATYREDRCIYIDQPTADRYGWR